MCGIHIITLRPIIANILPLLVFIGVDIESSPASLGTLLTAVVSGESGISFLINLLISMDDW